MFGTRLGAKTKDKKKTAAASGDHELLAIGHVEMALYTGQLTRDDRSGVDILIVGDINPTKLNKFIAELESKEGKELPVHCYVA